MIKYLVKNSLIVACLLTDVLMILTAPFIIKYEVFISTVKWWLLSDDAFVAKLLVAFNCVLLLYSIGVAVVQYRRGNCDKEIAKK